MTTTEHHYDYLLSVIADIRNKTGVGDRPMLSDLADAITAHTASVTAAKDAEIARLKNQSSAFSERLGSIEGGLELLRMAVAAGDTEKALTFRVNDLIKDCQKPLADPAQTVGEVDHGK